MRYWLSIGTFQLFGRFPVYGTVSKIFYWSLILVDSKSGDIMMPNDLIATLD